MDAPPSYEEAAASSSSSNPIQAHDRVRNGIPLAHRRSMEDEGRPLPAGWIRQYDPSSKHQFFVDTNVEPPRSIWHHPHDDEQYLNSLSAEERQRIQSLKKTPSKADMEAMSSDDESGHPHGRAPPPTAPSHPPSGLTKFGRKMKDKLTGTTHEQRVAYRRQREEEERQAYLRHLKYREAMTRAIETGQPQLIGKDKDGKNVYIEPPNGANLPPGGYGYNPYAQGPYNYAPPNSRYIRPDYPYRRPYGGGYGGGYGSPLLLGGGLLGGLLLGDALLGGF